MFSREAEHRYDDGERQNEVSDLKLFPRGIDSLIHNPGLTKCNIKSMSKNNVMHLDSIHDNLMIEIPGGNVELRDDRINQKWMVEIAPFLLSKFQVTQDLYFEVTKQNPSTFKGDRNPVETVNWRETVIFCNNLSLRLGFTPCYLLSDTDEEVHLDQTANGFRLPTEAEWQYACKAGTTGVRYGDLNKIAWYKANSGDQTHEVGLKEPNAWGLYDMLGNVWEWCSDLYDIEVYGTYRIFRGGGWSDEERSTMATARRRSHPTKFKIDDLGFRIAKNKT